MTTLGAIPGKFQVEWDDRRGSGVLVTEGFWDDRDSAAFFALLARLAGMSRARHGHAILLFDASNAVVQNGSLMQAAASGRTRTLTEDDRVALVVGSNLLKMQIKRNDAALRNTEFFVSRSAADTWLHAHVRVPA